ncbi:uncharacterized protein LOC135836241 isoform X2 [Planococcus citri]|uniref:uncharacterized protein LOC135836241 isoform X2 n=1 Tax=Planococcus citri TaxID=170843 RepID=UPI0031F7C674
MIIQHNLTRQKMYSNVLILCSLGTLIFIPISATMLGQLNWSPIYVGGNNQVDMWTKESKGCECQFNPSRKDCACCVKPGGCQCGSSAPNKCAQCGLQQYCNNMCNVTISQQSIFSESRSTVGQIKSPSLQGPALCWYLLQPDPGHRLELQIYRLVNVGRFNGTGCQSGYVHLVDEVDIKSGSIGVQICGENERFAPPVVLFADKGTATLTFRIEEATARSQFLAHYSFTPYNNTQGVGFRPVGGKRIENTGCDWLYQDFSCIKEATGCVLASPGFPGLYPSHITCRYHITMSSLRTKVKIVFTTLSLPHNNCATDYINVYQGPTSSSTLLATLCSNKKQDLVFSGPNLLIEFKSGATIPPYDYNGFVAKLEFVGAITTTEMTPVTSTATLKNPNRIPSSSEKSSKRSQEEVTVRQVEREHTHQPSVSGEKPCQNFFYGNITRSGHFDTRTLPWSTNCILIFIGQPTDLIHISLFNYQINASSCHSYIEIIDGDIRSSAFKLLKKLCSPLIKHARNSEGRFHEQQTFLSTGNYLSIHFKRHKPIPQPEMEYIDGAFSFLDGYAEGTLQPNTLCDVTYFGLTSSSMGRIHNHGSQHLFWNVEGPLRCSQKFVPTANQSVILKIMSLQRLSSELCYTKCGDSGCQCVNTQNKREFEYVGDYDHLLILNEYNVPLSCICGSYKEEWLPIIIRSWSPITVIYSVAKYNWAEKGFSFEAEYRFIYDSACGYRLINHHSGAISPVHMEQNTVLNYYYNQVCTWILNSNIERELFVEIASLQDRPCSAWNITIYEYVEESKDHTGRLLERFCPRDSGKVYQLPWKLNIVAIKLSAMTRTLPQFQIKWRSQVVRTNTRLSSPEVSANSGSYKIFHIFLNVSHVMFYFFILACK